MTVSVSPRWLKDEGPASRSGGHEIESSLGKFQSLGICFVFNQLYQLLLVGYISWDVKPWD